MVHREPDPDRSPAEFTLAVPAVGPRLRAQPQPFRLLAALAGALVLHAAAFAATVAVFDATFGGGGQDPDVIEISLVPGEALEAEKPGVAPVATGGVNLAEKPGLTSQPEAAAGANAEGNDLAKAETTPVEPPAALQFPPVADGKAVPSIRNVTEAPAQSALLPPGETVTAIEGGSSVWANAPSREDHSAATAASPGEIDAYNRSVAVTLARLKPKGVGETGTAKVVFRIGTAGTVDEVRIAASTGKSKLDRLATETVARARFDTPPTGMTSAQLTYAIAFRFR